MRALVGGLLAIACGSLVAASALAADIAIPAKVGVVKPGKLTKFVAKDPAGFALPTAGSADSEWFTLC